MQELIVDELERADGPLSLAQLKRRKPFRDDPVQFENDVRNLVRNGSIVRLKDSATANDKIELTSRIPPASDQLQTLLEEAKKKKKSGSYPAKAASLLKKVVGISQDGARAALESLVQSGRVLTSEGADNGEVVLSEDAALLAPIERLVDLHGTLAQFKETGDPKNYPVSLTRLMSAAKTPRGRKGDLKKRLESALDRPVLGIAAGEARHKGGSHRYFALEEDRELLELLTLKVNDLRRQVLHLWLEVQHLRAFKARAESARPQVVIKPDSAGVPGLPGELDQLQAKAGEASGEDARKLDLVLSEIRRASKADRFGWVRLSELRKRLSSITSTVLDQILRALGQRRLINLHLLNDASILKAGEREQVLDIDGRLYYAVSPRGEE